MGLLVGLSDRLHSETYWLGYILLLTVSLWTVEGEEAENHIPLVTNVKAEQVDFEHVLIRYDVEERGIR